MATSQACSSDASRAASQPSASASPPPSAAGTGALGAPAAAGATSDGTGAARPSETRPAEGPPVAGIPSGSNAAPGAGAVGSPAGAVAAGATGGSPAAGSGAAQTTSAAGSGGAGTPATIDNPQPFVLIPIGFPMYGDELTFPPAANPPENASPAFEWRGVPTNAKSLALVFRDLGNGAVKWILWDIPPSLTRIPANISKTAMPAEVPGSSQLGSLDNQGYAGPGSGARQYDFTLWALDTAKLPVTRQPTTVQIHDDVLPDHDIGKSPAILVRNTRNLQ